ncbi:1,3-beta-D-glucan synthase [Aureococcus anophagefferens]|nr:1,3-beta-D-glucan synthase [Aureococcus anophagefferens]
MPNFAEAMDFNNLTAAFLFACGALVATASSTFHLGASVLGSLCFAAIRPIFGGESDVFAFVGVSVCAVGAFSGGSARGSCRARRRRAARLHLRTLAAGGFAAFAAAGAAATRPDTEPLARHAAFGVAGAWLLTLGLDALLAEGAALWSHVVAVAGPHDLPGVPSDETLYLGEAEALLIWRYVAVGDDGEKPPATTRDDGSASKEARHHASLVGERPPRYNLFDPEALPEALKRFAPEVFASSEALGNFFGFQDDNVRNQAEHALMLLANGLAQQPPSSRSARGCDVAALGALHAKLFANYRRWCAHLETAPQFADAAAGDACGGAATDVVLWLCVWGEAANLRHMPECCCFLYHSAASEWAATPKGERQGDRGASLYPGHWLDTADHVDKKNYDDFNEFFWSKDCLRTHRSAVATATALRHRERALKADRAARDKDGLLGLENGHRYDRDESSFPPPVAHLLDAAPKTYLEVRTWLHVVFAFFRVYEYHVLSFQVLATVAFARYLVWDAAYTVEVLSGAALTINAAALLEAGLEAAVAPPSADGVAHGALATRLGGRFVCLVYQAMYLCWALDGLELMPRGEVRSLGGEEPGPFWFWQHVWLSCLVVVLYVAEAALQLWPYGITLLYTYGDGDVYRAALAVFLPRSLNYVGKTVHEPYVRAQKYHVFWLTLIAWKMTFGYIFLIKPMVAPTVQICDDYLNFPAIGHRGVKTMSQLVGRWLPSCLIFLVDSSIHYSLWAAAVGTYMGFRTKLGIVRDFPAVRDAFLLLPTSFCGKLVNGCVREGAVATAGGVPPSPRSSVAPELQRYFDDEPPGRALRRVLPRRRVRRAAGRRAGAAPVGEERDAADVVERSGFYLGRGVVRRRRRAPRLPSFLALTDALPKETASDQQLHAMTSPPPSGGLRQGILDLIETGGAAAGLSAFAASGAAADSALGEADEVQWVLFAEAWNDVVGAMRTSDTLNDFERDVLAFDRYAGFAKPVYLPIFVTAGAVERACALAADAAAAYRPAARAYHAARADDQADGGRPGLYDAAASVDEALGASLRADVVATEAVDEVRELGTWLLLKLAGGVHRDDLVACASILDKWCRSSASLVTQDTLLERVEVERLPTLVLQPLAQLATLLLKGLKKRKPKGDADLRAPTATPNSEGGPAAEEALPASGAPSQDGSEASMKEETKQDSVLSLAPKLDKAPSMKRTQSTSGLAAMGASPVASDLKAFTPRGPAQKAKKYSLASTKYVAGGHEHDGPNDPFRDAIREKLRGLLNGCKAVVVKGEPKQGVAGARARELLDRLTFVLANERGFFWDGKYASACLDALRGDLARVSRLAKKLQGLLTTTPRETEPRGQEATRRLTFFVNSLLMDMPPPPPLDATVSLTTLTPFYSEDVLLSKGDLLAKNSDGVTTLLYLQTLYKADWASFLERRKMTENSAHAECFAPEHELETRLWASFRAQTLARTVEGMMHCEAALRLLARLERVHGAHVARKRRTAGAQAPRRSSRYAAACEDSETHPVIGLEDLLKLKFGYVVSCQVYGKQRKNDDVKAKDIELLLRRFPLLRVAYIDEQRVGRSGAVAFYSCLVKAGEDGNPAEVYRVRLPGNPVIGEGKPENQNHAIVFTRGECLQTIDMNQDGFFEEALKMRNLLQEFKAGAPGVPEVPGAPPTTIVGFREHIFTGSVSSLANYMALQELSFVTLGQRVLADPLHMRLHYGHPDVFDKLWFATRGGVSKASKGINLSEDIFAGYTAMIPRRRRDHEGVRAGRQGPRRRHAADLQIRGQVVPGQRGAVFESGRVAHREPPGLPARLLSYYFGGIGHYINSALTIITIQVATYLALLLAVYGAESIGHRLVVPLGSVQILLAGLGLLNTLPLLATLAVERGLWAAAKDVAQVFASGGPLYFIFHIQTRAHYFTQTILAGGATYRATGRGFVTRHSTFDEQYRFFAASHLHLGVELSAALVLMGLHTEAGQYAGRTWSLWLAVGYFLLAPFWFNPLGFSWPHVADDFNRWSRWISYGTRGGGTAADSWDVWYKEETAPVRRLSGRSKALLASKALLYVALAKGLADFTGRAAYKRLMSFTYCAGAVVILAVLGWVADLLAPSLHYACHRLLKMALGVASVAVVAFELATKPSSLKFAVSLYYVGAAAALLGTLYGGPGPASYGRRRSSGVFDVVPVVVRHLARAHDLAVGYCYFAIFIPLSAIRICDVVQTWLLFHNALSEGVVVDDILKQARQSQEVGAKDTELELRNLRRQVETQQKAIARLLARAGVDDDGLEAGEVVNPVRDVTSEGEIAAAAPPQPDKPPVRSKSITSLRPAAYNTAPPPSGERFTFQSPDAMPPRALS